MRGAILTLALKSAAMGAALLSLQLTKTLFGDGPFLLLNQFLFVVGLHTCLTYGVQVTLWERGRPSTQQIAASFGTAALLTLVVTAIYGWGVATAAALGLYLGAKLLERLAFNSLIARARVTASYAVTLVAIAVEIAAFCGVWYVMGAQGNRFIFPSLAVAMVMIVPALHIMRTPLAGPAATADIGGKQHVLFAFHSFAILVTMMSDRLLFAAAPLAFGGRNGDYLLLYSYCSAVYALGVSLIEVRRPALIRLAGEVPSFRAFLRRSGFLPFAGTIGLMATLGLLAGVLFVDRWGGIMGLSPDTPVFPMLAGLVGFFVGFLLLSFVQVYHLATRSFGALFASWGVAAVVRFAAFAQPGWSGFLILSGIAGFAGFACLLLSNAGRASR